jgi:hypothetical protein
MTSDVVLEIKYTSVDHISLVWFWYEVSWDRTSLFNVQDSCVDVYDDQYRKKRFKISSNLLVKYVLDVVLEIEHTSDDHIILIWFRNEVS